MVVSLLLKSLVIHWICLRIVQDCCFQVLSNLAILIYSRTLLDNLSLQLFLNEQEKKKGTVLILIVYSYCLLVAMVDSESYTSSVGIHLFSCCECFLKKVKQATSNGLPGLCLPE